jgi:hypothetical protein
VKAHSIALARLRRKTPYTGIIFKISIIEMGRFFGRQLNRAP